MPPPFGETPVTPVVAVRPITNLTGDGGNEFFAAFLEVRVAALFAVFLAAVFLAVFFPSLVVFGVARGADFGGALAAALARGER